MTTPTHTHTTTAEAIAAAIVASCGCYARPCEADDGAAVVCLHGTTLEPWPVDEAGRPLAV